MKNLTLVFIFFLMVAHTSGQTANKWSLAVHYGPQISSFKKDGTSISPTHKIFGTQKAVIGKAYGADIELRKNKWIFGIGYTYCENKKRYEAQEGGAAIFDPAYAVRFTLRNIEQGFLLYADRKLNTRKRSEIFAGLGLLATRGDDQVIDIFYSPGNLSLAAIRSSPSVEAGVTGRFRWQYNWKQNVSVGAQLRVNYLVSVDVLSNSCFVPYLKIEL